MACAEELGVDETLTFLREVDSVNLRRRTLVADLARQAAGGSVRGKRIAVLGAAFRPDRHDVRDSPALKVADELRRDGPLGGSSWRSVQFMGEERLPV